MPSILDSWMMHAELALILPPGCPQPSTMVTAHGQSLQTCGCEAVGSVPHLGHLISSPHWLHVLHQPLLCVCQSFSHISLSTVPPTMDRKPSWLSNSHRVARLSVPPTTLAEPSKLLHPPRGQGAATLCTLGVICKTQGRGRQQRGGVGRLELPTHQARPSPGDTTRGRQLHTQVQESLLERGPPTRALERTCRGKGKVHR